MKLFTRLLIFALIVIYYNCNINARFATKDEARLQIDYDAYVEIDENYCSFSKIKEKILVLNEAGREEAVQNVIYNEDNEEFTLISAKIINIVGNKEISEDVTPNNIEDKQISTNAKGFANIRQVKIAFPNVSVGSIIIFEYSIKEKISRLPDMCSYVRYLRNNFELINSLNCIIKSKVPLRYYVNDPLQIFDIKTNTNLETQRNVTSNWFNEFELKLKKPIINTIANEHQNTRLNDKDCNYFVISSISSWDHFKDILAPYYMEVINEEIPEIFSDIINDAKQYRLDKDKIEFVLNKIHERIYYMGNWRETRNGYLPHSLSEIAEFKFIDCKGFSSLAGAILSHLGFNASVAIVLSSSDGSDFPTSAIPYSGFNHAILYIKNKETSKEYFLDPTMRVAIIDFIPDHIANKRVLILHDEKIKSKFLIDSQNSIAKIINKLQNHNIKLLSLINYLDYENSNQETLNLQNNQKFSTLKCNQKFGVLECFNYNKKNFFINDLLLNNFTSNVSILEQQTRQIQYNPSTESLLVTKELDPNENKTITTSTITVQEDDLKINMQIKFIKNAASFLTSIENYYSKKIIENYLFNMFCSDVDLENRLSSKIPSLRSYRLRDLDIWLEFINKDAFSITNLGSNKGITLPLNHKLIMCQEDSITDLVLTPSYQKNIDIIKNLHFDNIEIFNFEIDTEYFLIKRKCKREGDDTKITTTQIIKERFIPNEYLKSKEYKDIFIKLKEQVKAFLIK